MRTLETLQFDNTYARLPESFYARVMPTPLPNPSLIHFNSDAAALIDLDSDEAKRPEFAACFGGSLLLPGADPVSMLYYGHQFGVYAGQLGDGRAILLGEVRNGHGDKWDLHLKGAGRTPFSRDGDGRAVLRSTIREYLCGEAMQGLGIPTTRSLCIVGSDEPVFRESVETGATLLRMAPTHVRFGSFEAFFYRRQHDHIARLTDYVIAQCFPHLAGVTDTYSRMFTEVAVRTAHLIAQWQAVGFAHGVMNSDNMSILGLTLDYGPYGFLDEYNPGFVCNHSDRQGRYAFHHQPDIGYFNLRCLAQALSPFLIQDQAQDALARYEAAFAERYDALMREKLGLREAGPEDRALVGELLNLLQAGRVDYTNFFRALGGFQQGAGEHNDALRDFFLDREAFDAWAGRYRERLSAEGSRDGERRARMDRVNPKYVLRNYLAQTAIEQATKQRDYSEITRLLELLRDPFTEVSGREPYAAPPPEGGKQIVVSCSS
ncbi:MAG: YdiU family protein [Nitrospirae bacterium]|nr:MAG: YdiU family protein [Nitrospirota bacterium]